jgi:hypothetical protein
MEALQIHVNALMPVVGLAVLPHPQSQDSLLMTHVILTHVLVQALIPSALEGNCPKAQVTVGMLQQMRQLQCLTVSPCQHCSAQMASALLGQILNGIP